MAAGSLSSAKDNLKALFEGCRIQEFPKDKTIIYEGDAVNKIYCLVSGYVKVCAYLNGGTQRIVYIYKKGDVFPLTTYLSGSEVARFFYETMAPVKVKVLSSRQLEKKLEDDLGMGESLILYTTTIDRQFIKRVHEMISSGTPLAKIIASLKFLINHLGKGRVQARLDIPITANCIAALSGLSTKEVLTQMTYLKEKKVLLSVGDGLIIDRAKLKELKT